MPSLKSQLNNFIEKNGYVTLDQVHSLVKVLGSKQRTAERYLNQGVNKSVKTEYNEHKQIVGYRWLGTQETTPERTFTRPIMNCQDENKCWHYKTFKYCSCPLIVKEKENALW